MSELEDDRPLAPHLRAALLAEGLEGGPSQDQRARMAAKLAIAVGVPAAALLAAKAIGGAAGGATTAAAAQPAASAGAQAASGATSAGTVAKTAALSGKAIAVIVGSVLVGTGVGVTIGELHGRSGRSVTTPEIAVTATVHDAAIAPPVETSDAPADVADPIDAPAAPVDAATSHATAHRPDASPAPAADQLARERELIDVARSALRAGDSRLATKSLVEHELRFPTGALTEERRALAIEVAVTKGDRAKAQTLATEFRSAYPHSVFQARIDELLK